MLHAPVSLSHTAYEVLWERADLGVMPAPISINYPLRCLDSGARMARETVAELAPAGLIRDGEVHSELVATLRALTNAEHRYYAVHLSETQPHGRGPLVAVDGRAAVLASIDADALHLRPVHPDQAVGALVATLPQRRPGNGRALSFAADELAADGTPVRPDEYDGGVLTQTRHAQTDVDRYIALMTRPRTAMTYLYAVHHGVRCAQPMVAIDIKADGCLLTCKQSGTGGAEWIMAVPASRETLVQQLTALR